MVVAPRGEAASSVRPRHVLCFLSGEQGLAQLSEAAKAAIKAFATGFQVDTNYSQDEPDERMARSLGFVGIASNRAPGRVRMRTPSSRTNPCSTCCRRR